MTTSLMLAAGLCCLLQGAAGAVYTPGGGPVYVQPGSAPLQSEPLESQPMLTQTVYGFLDFTTTIGNTVMVFSPQSQPADSGTKKAPPEQPVTKVSVIETKPTAPVSELPQIKPSKTTSSPSKSSSEKVSEPVKKPPAAKESAIPLSSVVEVRVGGVTSTDAVTPAPSVVEVPPPVVLSSKVEVRESPPSATVQAPLPATKPASKVVADSVVQTEEQKSDEPALSGNNLVGPAEYDFLSRQPSEVVEETYKVIDLRPGGGSGKGKHRGGGETRAKSPASRPTGLVTSMGGTVVKEGVTTVHETSVIGTYISGKYAQVLQSTTHVYRKPAEAKVAPSPSTRILKTLAPPQLKPVPKHSLEPTPATTLQEDSALPLEALFSQPAGNLIRQSRRPAVANSFKNRFGNNRANSNRVSDNESPEEDTEEHSPSPAYKKYASRPRHSARPSYKYSNNRFARPSAPTPELTTVSVFTETSNAAPARRYQTSRARSGFRPSANSNAVDSGSRRYKPKPSAAIHEPATTSLYKFKLARPAGRWQYKTTPKPRVTIRRQDGEMDNVTMISSVPELGAASPGAGDQQGEGSDVEATQTTEQPLPIETIKVEISTPADHNDIYYEIATIKSPYTFQVGTVKNTRYITVTSTLEKSFVEATEAPSVAPSSTEPLTENILATASNNAYHDKEPPLDSSIATLPPIGLASDAETPPLETSTETFSTTQLLLKTHILPVIRGSTNTTLYTLVQSYHVTRIVTAIKTLPPMEVYQFVPSKTLNEFNTRLDEAGSELHLELDFGDNNNNNNDEDELPAARAFPPDLDLANIGSEFDLSEVDKGHPRLKKAHTTPSAEVQTTPPPPSTTVTSPTLSPEQLQQLALYRFLNPNPAIPQQVVTTSKPVVKMETLYESHVVPYFNGQTTVFSTLSRPVATVARTTYEYGTSTMAPLNPLGFPPQPQFAVASTPVVTQTVVTATESKILKLTFGAKTAYTTLFSTRVVPTLLTTYLTASIPVQPTAPAFPGFNPFQQPFNPYNFVG